MHDTLSSLVERALAGNQRPLEFYLREQSRLPGSRANLELVSDVSNLLAAVVSEQPSEVRMLLNYLVTDAKTVTTNTPDEFIALCGVVAFGACAVVRAEWRSEVFALLGDFAYSAAWRVGGGVCIAFSQLLLVGGRESIGYLGGLRKAVGYTVSVVAAGAPEKGFALMRECAGWGDADINWVLRENLKKKRLAKYAEHTEMVSKLLA